MKIKKCCSCAAEMDKYSILPVRFPWSRETGEEYFYLECENCGKIFAFSWKQYVALFMLHSLMLAWLIICDNFRYYVIPISFLTIYWGSQWICNFLWDSSMWKQIDIGKSFSKKTSYFLFWFVYACSFPGALVVIALLC